MEGLRVLGKPEEFAEYYYESGTDVSFYQDIVASLYERNSLSEIISKTAKSSFIPLMVEVGKMPLNQQETIETIIKHTISQVLNLKI